MEAENKRKEKYFSLISQKRVVITIVNKLEYIIRLISRQFIKELKSPLSYRHIGKMPRTKPEDKSVVAIPEAESKFSSTVF